MTINKRSRLILLAAMTVGFIVLLSYFSASKMSVYAAEPTVRIDKLKYNETIKVGQDSHLTGKVVCSDRIAIIEVGIVDLKTHDWTTHKYTNYYVNSKEFDLSRADSDLDVKSLPEGTFIYRIYVHTETGHSLVALDVRFYITKDGKVQKEQSAQSQESDQAESAKESEKKPDFKITLKRMKKPGNITTGKAFSVKGGVYTSEAMKKMVVGIVDKESGEWLYKYTNKKVNDKYFALSRSDSKLLFSKLTEGAYYYRIKITTASGTKTALNHEFSVKNPELKTEFLRMYYPKKLNIGKDYDIRGRINTNLKIRKLEVGIVDKASGKWVYVYKNNKVNAKTFAFSAADSSLKFKKLPAGEYYYRINVFTKYGSKRAYNKAFQVVDPEAEARAKKEAEEKAKKEAEEKAKKEAEAKAKAEAEAKAKKEAEERAKAEAAAAANSPKATTPKAKLTAGTYMNGIDVSTFQGNVDWPKVKPSGIEFAIIRAGYRGYTNGGLCEDNKFKRNMTGAKAAGLKVGVYFFSQAINYKEGVAEANYVCDLLEKNKYTVDFPIAVDSEYISSSKPGRADRITKTARTQAIKGFCDQIKKRGYESMIYASTNWFDSHLDMKTIGNVKLWAAQWSSTRPTDRAYSCWQYTSDGGVPGITGRVDMNVWFY